jgi:beta-lactamase class A
MNKKQRHHLNQKGKRALASLIISTILVLSVTACIKGLINKFHHPAKPEVTLVKKQQPKKTKTKTKSKANTPTKKLEKQWQKTLADVDNDVSIAVYSKKNDQIYAYTNAPDTKTYPSASIIKATFLAKLLHEHSEKKTYLTSTEQLANPKMIENSDNSAANTIYSRIGSAKGLGNAFQDLDMTDSVALASGWALTPTTPKDQLKLLNTIFYPSDYLTDNSKKYMKSLMSHVASNQQWGISAGSKYFQIKNGWKQQSDSHWIVNSIGHLGKGDDSCTIAVMSTENPTLEKGEKLVEQLASETGEVLKIR